MAKIKAFYKKCGYGATDSVNSNDLILVAEINNVIVGIVRICKENGVKVLRGMQVAPEFRGHKTVGPALRDECGLRLGAECYCIAYAHLVSFYERIMFRGIPECKAPDFLQKRILRYREKHHGQKEYVLMRRPPNFI